MEADAPRTFDDDPAKTADTDTDVIEETKAREILGVDREDGKENAEKETEKEEDRDGDDDDAEKKDESKGEEEAAEDDMKRNQVRRYT